MRRRTRFLFLLALVAAGGVLIASRAPGFGPLAALGQQFGIGVSDLERSMQDLQALVEEHPDADAISRFETGFGVYGGRALEVRAEVDGEAIDFERVLVRRLGRGRYEAEPIEGERGVVELSTEVTDEAAGIGLLLIEASDEERSTREVRVGVRERGDDWLELARAELPPGPPVDFGPENDLPRTQFMDVGGPLEETDDPLSASFQVLDHKTSLGLRLASRDTD